MYRSYSRLQIFTFSSIKGLYNNMFVKTTPALTFVEAIRLLHEVRIELRGKRGGSVLQQRQAAMLSAAITLLEAA